MATLFENVGRLFGFEVKRPEKEELEKTTPSFAPQQHDDGAVVVTPSGGFFGSYIDFDGAIKSEAELINKYRDMAEHPEIDSAIEDIIDEAIVTEDGEKTVQIVLDDIPNLPPKIKQIIEIEFDNVLRLLEFNTKSYDIFRRWYVDGRLYYHVMINDLAPEEGIREVRYLDPRRIRKIREVAKTRDPKFPNLMLQKTVNEYYIYSDKDFAGGQKTIMAQPANPLSGLKIAKDSIVFCTSGKTNVDGSMVVGFLQKAIKPLNQLRALEDATVIYRISRAPERRIFYIDVGTLPKHKAEQYVQDMITKHKNKLVYDSVTGQIRDDRKFMTMIEDYWIPRREGSTGTQIANLPAGQNLGKMEDVEYFQKKLYNALNVPLDRIDSEGTMFDIGHSMQITRSEVKFAKFIDRLRLKFSDLFLKVLEKQLVLKMIVSPEEWDEIQANIKFRFLRDNDFAELKDQEIMASRVNILTLITPFVGRYVSNMWVRKNILKQDDQDIEQIDAEIAQEVQSPQYAFPMAMANQIPMPGVNVPDPEAEKQNQGPSQKKTLHEEESSDVDIKLKETLIGLLEKEYAEEE